MRHMSAGVAADVPAAGRANDRAATLWGRPVAAQPWRVLPPPGRRRAAEALWRAAKAGRRPY